MLFVGISLLLLSWGVWLKLGEWRFQAGLERARKEIATRRFDQARGWLAAQALERPEFPEIAFLLGVCEHARARPEAALAAWSRVPLESPFGVKAVVARAQVLVGDLGRFADAEAVLAAALASPGKKAPEIRYLLSQLFYWEGRLDEMRRLLQEGWDTSPDRAGDLYDLWRIDGAVMLVDRVRTVVEQAAGKAPDDDRVWLARANLALLSGRAPEAAEWLGACLKRRPDDPVVWRAWLRWAREADRADEARRALAHLPADRFSLTEILALRVWFAARAGDSDAERTALEQLVVQVPGDTRAVERLTALALKAGQSALHPAGDKAVALLDVPVGTELLEQVDRRHHSDRDL